VVDPVHGDRRRERGHELQREAGRGGAARARVLGSASSLARCCEPPGRRRHRPVLSHCLTIATAPNPSTDGQMVTISGRLLGPRRDHAVVLLWRRLPGQRRFHATVPTASGVTR
jgi:hypothetical protein